MINMKNEMERILTKVKKTGNPLYVLNKDKTVTPVKVPEEYGFEFLSDLIMNEFKNFLDCKDWNMVDLTIFSNDGGRYIVSTVFITIQASGGGYPFETQVKYMGDEADLLEEKINHFKKKLDFRYMTWTDAMIGHDEIKQKILMEPGVEISFILSGLENTWVD